jgi:galacturan 1,4-alpha-galacturonidase
MRHVGKSVKDINIAYIGGGSRGWAWHLMSDLALEGQLSGTVRLYDIDFEAAHNNEIIGNRLSEREDALGKWNYVAVKTIEEALTDADFVVISIVPGTFEEMASDVHLPEKYGIYQSVGDSTGPGGMVRALRTIPMYVEFSNKIKECCPEAWVINYTNPMGLCTRTLYEVFPEVKAFGCCHEVFITQNVLAAMLEEMKGITGIKREEIKVNILGINHFTWFDKAYYQDMDLMPLYKEFVEKHYEEGFIDKHKVWSHKCFSYYNRVKFDLFKRYGLIAAAGDRHLAEFMPPWYLKNPETVEGWKFGLTPVEWRVENRERLIEKAKRLAAGEEQVELKPSGEEGVRQIKALVGLEDLITNVNIPNKGQIEGMPLGAVVETNAYFGVNKVQPIMSGKMPEPVHNLVIRHVLNNESILKAALTKDKELAFRAFANDPLVNIDVKEAEELFDQMLQNTKKYLPGWEL